MLLNGPRTSYVQRKKLQSENDITNFTSLPNLDDTEGWKPIAVTLTSCDEATLAKAIQLCVKKGGVLHLNGLNSMVPFQAVSKVLEFLGERPDLATRANEAYIKNLVYKDSFANGKGGPKVDEKRVLDLSPARLETIVKVDPSIEDEFGEPLREALCFFDDMRKRVAPQILNALTKAIGKSSALDHTTLFNYRMIDYYERDSSSPSPRCGEHRDFGTFTLIFPDRSTSGLEAFVDREWKPVPLPDEDGAILLFGYCTQFRSNGRIPASLHRVNNPVDVETGRVPRRLACIMFAAPEQEADISPVVVSDYEVPSYKELTAGDLKIMVGRKWRYREGTCKDKEAIVEEQLLHQFKDSDALINLRYRT